MGVKKDRPRLRLETSSRLEQFDWLVLISGFTVILLRQGFHWQVSRLLADGVAHAALLLLLLTLALRTRILPRESQWWQPHWATITVMAVGAAGWLLGWLLYAAWGLPSWPTSDAAGTWAQLILILRLVAQAAIGTRQVAARGWNPALVLAVSFGVLISSGMLLLMLPASRVQVPGSAFEEGAPWPVALFTATSACCVTGLTVVDTGTYWSRTGQTILMMLIQLGGLGVMTFGAFFAAGIRRGFLLKESALMGTLLEKDDVLAMRRLVLSILLFTLASELIGTAMLVTLSPPGPWQERLFFGAFHSVSAFCNAGFAFNPRSLELQEMQWQVWGGIAGLIIVGGLGFDVLQNTSGVIWGWVKGQRPPVRLTLTSRIVLVTSGLLLLLGTVAFLWLEWGETLADQSLPRKFSNAWFQSVSCRTAGFNTVDIAALHPATKLVAIALMFIGASPGSTGGGVKTVVFALTVLAPLTVLARRERMELAGRTIPDELVKRASVVVALGLAIVMTSTFAMVTIEDKPKLFLEHLFEVTSAFGTVGLSTGITAGLKLPSKMILVITMFMGRVGPLTLLVALAGKERDSVYRYPEERVLMG